MTIPACCSGTRRCRPPRASGVGAAGGVIYVAQRAAASPEAKAFEVASTTKLARGRSRCCSNDLLLWCDLALPRLRGWPAWDERPTTPSSKAADRHTNLEH